MSTAKFQKDIRHSPAPAPRTPNKRKKRQAQTGLLWDKSALRAANLEHLPENRSRTLEKPRLAAVSAPWPTGLLP